VHSSSLLPRSSSLGCPISLTSSAAFAFTARKHFVRLGHFSRGKLIKVETSVWLEFRCVFRFSPPARALLRSAAEASMPRSFLGGQPPKFRDLLGMVHCKHRPRKCGSDLLLMLLGCYSLYRNEPVEGWEGSSPPWVH
jgi:hypothetical protein